MLSYCCPQTLWPRQLIKGNVHFGLTVPEEWKSITIKAGRCGSRNRNLRFHISIAHRKQRTNQKWGEVMKSFKYFLRFILYIWVFCLHVCMCSVHAWSMEGMKCPETGIADDCEPLCGCRELSLCLLHEQQVLLLTGPSLQPQAIRAPGIYFLQQLSMP